MNMLNKLFKRKVSPIGLDIDSGSIKLVELSSQMEDGGYLIKSYGWQPLPAEALEEGFLKKSEAVKEALKTLLDEKNIEKKSTVNLCLSGKHVQIRQIDMPQMPVPELEAAMQFEAEKYIPVNLESMILDFSIIGSKTIDGAPHYTLLLASAPRNLIEPLVQLVQECNLRPNALEVEPLTLYRLWKNQYLDEELPNQALIHVGSVHSQLVIFQEDMLRFNRLIPLAGEESHVELVLELRRSLEFYHMQTKLNLDRLILTGESANEPDLDAFLEAELELPVLIGGYRNLDTAYSLASGLALRDLMDI